MTKKELIIGISAVIGLIVAIIGIGYWIKRNKAKKIFPAIEQKIDQGVGINGNDIASTLFGVKPDPNYSKANADAKAIYDAKGTFYDDKDTVFATITNKTKAQLAAINQSMQNLYGKTLDAVIADIFSNCYHDKLWPTLGIGIDCGDYDRAMSIIKSGK